MILSPGVNSTLDGVGSDGPFELGVFQFLGVLDGHKLEGGVV